MKIESAEIVILKMVKIENKKNYLLESGRETKWSEKILRNSKDFQN